MIAVFFKIVRSLFAEYERPVLSLRATPATKAYVPVRPRMVAART